MPKRTIFSPRGALFLFFLHSTPSVLLELEAPRGQPKLDQQHIVFPNFTKTAPNLHDILAWKTNSYPPPLRPPPYSSRLIIYFTRSTSRVKTSHIHIHTHEMAVPAHKVRNAAKKLVHGPP